MAGNKLEAKLKVAICFYTLQEQREAAVITFTANGRAPSIWKLCFS